MNLLIITDSNTTSLSSSFFSLLLNLQKKQCNIYILDKAEVTNSNFFQMNDSANFFCHKIEKDYSYQHYINYTYKTKQKSVNDFTALWIRLDPPIPNEFLYFIENYFANILMINSSKGIIKSSSKKFLLNYPELCPDMKLCRSIKDIKNFSAKFPIVIKPLNSFGGIGLCRLDNDIGYIEETKSSAKEVLKKLDTAMKNGEHFLAVKFLKNVIKGDKRVLVVNSEIVGVLNRVPAKDKWLANLTQGATSEKDVISKRDREIQLSFPEI